MSLMIIVEGCLKMSKFRCDVCDFECNNIPTFKENECPFEIQHYFSEVENE